MGAVTDGLARAAVAAGAEIVHRRRGASRSTPTARSPGAGGARRAQRAGATVLAGLRARPCSTAARRGRCRPGRDRGRRPRAPSSRSTCCCPGCRGCATQRVDPAAAFAGTFHINEGYAQLAGRVCRGRRRARCPTCRRARSTATRLSDRIDPRARAGRRRRADADAVRAAPAGPAVPRGQRGRARKEALAAHPAVAELGAGRADRGRAAARRRTGARASRSRTPVDLEQDLGLPGGNIFHRSLQWPWAEHDAEVGTWGVETAHERVLHRGAGARRGGGVSGIPGHNAAQAVLAGAPARPGARSSRG